MSKEIELSKRCLRVIARVAVDYSQDGNDACKRNGMLSDCNEKKRKQSMGRME